MNILQINTRYIGGGGAAAIANLLHKSINKQDGINSRFLYGRGYSDDNKAIKIANEFESYISAGATRIIGKELNRSISTSIKKEIDNSDIIHIHNLHGYYIDYESLINYIVEKKKKVIWTLHDTWGFTGRCAFTFGCDKWKYGCGNCRNLNIYPTTKRDLSDKLFIKKKEIFTKLDREKTILVTPSIWLKRLVEESYLSKYRIEVINNGVEESKFIDVDKEILRRELDIPTNRKIVLFVAADPNDERKGIKYILDIIKKVSDDFLFISIGKKINYQSDKFIQLGYISDRNKLYKVYSASDVFIIPSLDDNFPTTVLEAFANGVPVVGFDSGGIKEQIIEGVNGEIVYKRKDTEIINSLNKVIKDNTLSTKKKIIDEFNKKYTQTIFVNKNLKLYE